jgi:hypothetical protein
MSAWRELPQDPPCVETRIVACNRCILNPSALTYLLIRVVFGLTFDCKSQGASWPA